VTDETDYFGLADKPETEGTSLGPRLVYNSGHLKITQEWHPIGTRQNHAQRHRTNSLGEYKVARIVSPRSGVSR
jgi:hypothetical protein